MEDREELPDPWILFTDGSSWENKKADALSKISSTSFTHLSKQVLVEELREKAIDEKEVLAEVEEEGHTWMTLVYEYLTEGVLPEEKKKARTVRRKAGRYAVINEVLYKKIFLGSWLRYIGPLQKLTWPKTTKPWALVWTSYKKREQAAIQEQGIKPKWKDITMPEFEAPAFVQETLSTGTMKQAMWKTEQART
nr:reverse transcriptase domain-containing protein [Tanacetum cinerariifolium]